MIHCVLWERRTETAVVWYRNDEVQGAGEFWDSAEAEDWASSLRAELLRQTGRVLPVSTP